ncbi:hypothetical protein FKM82_004944 [Ascaphus truei]
MRVTSPAPGNGLCVTSPALPPLVESSLKNSVNNSVTCYPKVAQHPRGGTKSLNNHITIDLDIILNGIHALAFATNRPIIGSNSANYHETRSMPTKHWYKRYGCLAAPAELIPDTVPY